MTIDDNVDGSAEVFVHICWW